MCHLSILTFFLSLSLFSSVSPGNDGFTQGFTEFHDDFRHGVLSSSNWFVMKKKWGKGNNGVSPWHAAIEKDTVNGVSKNVLALHATGDRYKGPIPGLSKKRARDAPRVNYYATGGGTRVGSGVCTSKYYASGRYEVVMKVGDGSAHPFHNPSGMAPSIWTFHYQEHYSDTGSGADGSKGATLDPQYNPAHRAGTPNLGYFSTVNSELDVPELGKGGNLNQGWYNTYSTEVLHKNQVGMACDDMKSVGQWDCAVDASTTSKIPLGTVTDGGYHNYTTVWKTELKDTDCVGVPHVAYDYHFCSTDGHEHFALPMTNGKVFVGRSVEYYYDGVKVGSQIHGTSHPARPSDQSGANMKVIIPSISARLCIAAWMPNWSGPADWEESLIRVSEVRITPFLQDGDIFWQHESYPDDGLFRPEDFPRSHAPKYVYYH